MKNLILLLVSIIISMSAMAQVTIIPEVGATFSKLDHDVPEKSQILTQPTMGIIFSKPFAQNWGRGCGLKYLRRGSRGIINGSVQKMRFDYLDISIILSKSFYNNKISFDAHMTGSYLLSRKWDIDGQEQQLPNNLRVSDFTLELAVNVLITNDVHLTARYSQGTVDMSTTKMLDIDFAKHSVLSLTLSKHFFTKAIARFPRFD